MDEKPLTGLLWVPVRVYAYNSFKMKNDDHSNLSFVAYTQKTSF